MRLAKRFRPYVSSRLKRINQKKSAKRIAANYALLKALAEADKK